MTIRQLPKPCFEFDPDPYDDDDEGLGSPHFATEAEADTALAELREDRAPDPELLAELAEVRVRELAMPCWVAECDAPDGPEGTCGDTLGDEDEGPACIHFETSDQAIDWMPYEGWAQDGPDGALCSTHRPDDSGDPPPLLPSPAELEAAGQLVLPGVLPS
jgi:hypothetical protein